MHKDFSVSLKADYSLVSVSIYCSFSPTWNIQSPCLHWLLWIQVHISSMNCLPNFHRLPERHIRNSYQWLEWLPKLSSFPPGLPSRIVCSCNKYLSHPRVPQILGIASPTTVASQVLQVSCIAILQSNHKPLQSGPLTRYSNGRWIVSASALKRSPLGSANPGCAPWL